MEPWMYWYCAAASVTWLLLFVAAIVEYRKKYEIDWNRPSIWVTSLIGPIPLAAAWPLVIIVLVLTCTKELCEDLGA
jgi:hypothetical protein